MARRPKDLRCKTQDYLRAMIDHDPYLDHIGREVLEMSIQVLENVRNLEDSVIKKAEELQAGDKARAVRLGTDPEAVPALDNYLMVRGTVF